MKIIRVINNIKREIEFQKLSSTNNLKPSQTVFTDSLAKRVAALIIGILLMLICIIPITVLFVSFARLVSSGVEGVNILLQKGWSGKLHLNVFEGIAGIFGMATGGGIGQLLWYFIMIKTKFISKEALFGGDTIK